MAVSAAYIALTHIPSGSASGRESVQFSNIATTTAAFILEGGLYGLSVVGVTFGSVTLQVLGYDGTTWMTAATAVAANGYSTANLMSGKYRFALA